MSMKKFISLFLVCFLVIATLGVGTSQANVIEKDAWYVDVGVDVDAIAFEIVVAEVRYDEETNCDFHISEYTSSKLCCIPEHISIT